MGAVLARGQNRDGLYEWPFGGGQCNLSYQTTKVESQESWHRRLGYPNKRVLKTLLQNFSIPVSHLDKFDYCNSCSSNKSHRLPFSQNTLRSTYPLQIIFSDLWGPSLVISIDKKLYYVIFVD